MPLPNNSNYQMLQPTLRCSIEKIIEKGDFLQCEIEIKDYEKNNDSFLGKLYEINIKGITSEREKEINIFVKEKIVLRRLNVFNTDQLFSTEIFMYKDISKIFTSLQDKANMSLEERYKLPKAFDESSEDAIIIENLRKKGFGTYTKYDPISVKYFELGIQELAKFHALSFVIENEMPEFFKESITTLECPLHFDDDWVALMKTTFTYIANMYDSEMKTKIADFLPVLIEKIPKYYTDKSEICTLTHGDYKTNNVMVRIIDGEPMEVMPVDFQFIDYGCPIRDFLFFIFTGTDREFRRRHFDDLKELYFETLTKFLKYFGMDVETVYPKADFERLCTEWLDFGLMMTLYFAPSLFVPDTGFNFENISYSEVTFCPEDRFLYRLRELIDELVENGYL